MNTRRFGCTGLEISELTLGGGFVGGLLLHARDDEKRACIAACLGAGVNLIDTAAAYGNGESEKALNWLLGELPADERHGREGPITANAGMAAEEARARAVRTALGDRTETRAQTAIRFGLANPAVSTVVFGVAVLSQVREALAAPALGPLEEGALTALRRVWTTDRFRTQPP